VISISLPIFILVIVIEALAFSFFIFKRKGKLFIKNKEKVIDSIRRIQEDLNTLEYRIKLNEREKK